MVVKGVELRSASVLVKSEGSGTYVVSAVVNFSGENINSFEQGDVHIDADNIMVASWSRYSPNNLNVNFMTEDKEQMCAITEIINQFIESVSTDTTIAKSLSL